MPWIASIWAWLAIGTAVLLGLVLQAVLFVVTWPFDRRRYVVGRTLRWMAIVSAKLNPLWDFGVSGPTPKSLRGKYVVVSNHESNADPFLISFLPWEMKWMAKESLFKIPVFGWTLWLSGDVRVRRGDRTSGGRALKDCARWLAKGMPVLIFPEGTRSKDGVLLPFKDGAFRLAVETGAAILPLAVSGTRESLPKGSLLFGRAKARVVVGTPIESAGKTVEALKAEALAQIVALRDGLRRQLAEGAQAAGSPRAAP